MKLFFSYSPPLRIHPPPPSTPFPGSRFRVVSRSFSSRFRVDFEARLENDSKSTQKRPKKRLEIDSLGGGRWWWGMNPGGWAVAEKQFHYLKVLRTKLFQEPHVRTCPIFFSLFIWNSLLFSFARNSLHFERSSLLSQIFELRKRNLCFFGGLPCNSTENAKKIRVRAILQSQAILKGFPAMGAAFGVFHSYNAIANASVCLPITACNRNRLL